MEKIKQYIPLRKKERVGLEGVIKIKRGVSKEIIAEVLNIVKREEVKWKKSEFLKILNWDWKLKIKIV